VNLSQTCRKGTKRKSIQAQQTTINAAEKALLSPIGGLSSSALRPLVRTSLTSISSGCRRAISPV